MAQGWKRPENIPFPSVWHRFTGKKEINGVLPKFWVQDLSEDYYELSLKLMCDHFLKDEPLTKYSDVKTDPHLNNESISFWRECFKDRLAIICLMENPDPNGKPIVAGLNITHLSHKGETKIETKSEKINRVIGALDLVKNLRDPFESLKINEHLGAVGLLVLPEFRGQSLGLEILKSREPLCRAVGLKATVTSFTSIISQKLAEKCGFKVLCEMTYEEIERQDPKLSFPGIKNHTKSLKVMYMLFE